MVLVRHTAGADGGQMNREDEITCQCQCHTDQQTEACKVCLKNHDMWALMANNTVTFQSDDVKREFIEDIKALKERP